MPEMTLAEAAKWAGKGKPAILKAIQKGHLSASKAEDGTWRIDPSELARVYSPGNGGKHFDEGSQTDKEAAEDVAGMHRELALLREMVSRADATAADLRTERDAWKEEAGRWQAQAEAQTRLLTHQKANTPPVEGPKVPATPTRPSLLARLIGRT